MARTGITQQEVWAAADALAADDVRPTIKLVRERLGGTGSPNTIHAHLQTWNAARPAQPTAVRSLPEGLVTALLGALEAAGDAMSEACRAELAEMQRANAELAVAGAQLERELANRQDANDALRAERDCLRGRLAEQAEVAQKTSLQFEAARAALEAQRQRAESLSAGQVELSAKVGRLEQALEEERESRTQLQQERAVQCAELRVTQERLSEALGRESVAVERLNQALATERAQAEALAAERARFDAARQELEHARQWMPMPMPSVRKYGPAGTLHLPKKLSKSTVSTPSGHP